MKGRKVGIVKEGFEKCDEDIANIVMRAANSLTEVGAIVEEISIPLHSEGNKLVDIFMAFHCCYSESVVDSTLVAPCIYPSVRLSYLFVLSISDDNFLSILYIY